METDKEFEDKIDSMDLDRLTQEEILNNTKRRLK